MNRILLSFLAAGMATAVSAPADAFWVARGWHGGVAVGGFRAPSVARDVYYPRCWRCAPVYPAGAVAGAALAGAAVAGAAMAAPAPVAQVPAAPTVSETPAKPPATKVAATNAAATQCAAGLPSDSK